MHLYVAVFGDEFEAVEIRAHLRDVVDNGCDAKDGWVSAVVLHIRNNQQTIKINKQKMPSLEIHLFPKIFIRIKRDFFRNIVTGNVKKSISRHEVFGTGIKYLLSN